MPITAQDMFNNMSGMKQGSSSSPSPSGGGDPTKLLKIGDAVAKTGSAIKAGQAASSANLVSGVAGPATQAAAAKTATAVAAKSAATKSVIAALLFYGGESVSDLKNHPSYQVNTLDGMGSLKANTDKCFYKNVSIPRKQV
jgi:hypothetical protein